MPVIEREIEGFELPSSPPSSGSSIKAFSLISSANATHGGFTWTLDFPIPNAYRVLLLSKERVRPPHDNVILQSPTCEFTLTSIDAKACTATFGFPSAAEAHFDGSEAKRELRLEWATSIVLSSWETDHNGKWTRIVGDLANRSYALTENGVMRHWWFPFNNIHLGMGEKAGPVDLTGRSFQLHGQDSACYDAMEGDPLYKHTPYLISTPRPTKDGKQGSSYAVYHATNSYGTWDLGRAHDDPSGYFTTYIQDFGGLEEWIIVGKGVKEIVRTFGEMVGMTKLVGRDWLGYLASGMGLGETDHPPAQQLLEGWPELCKKYDIPCSAMHLSSGYTADEKDGNRYVFTMNKKRYPDFKAMVGVFHKAGIKVVPNIKPYLLGTHPHYDGLYKSDAFFHDPWTKSPVQVRIWSSGVGVTAKGGWSDMTSKEGREWWSKGVQSLIDLGVDGAWNDNNEYYLRDDVYECKNDMPHKMASPIEGKQQIGLMGRMINTELMAKVSNDTLAAANPDRRTYVLTRSGNVGTFKYACSTWSGDNFTSWNNLRGSQPIQLNAGLSLMQAYGSDVGGFGGPLPSPELFVRWVQLGVTHSRFCIHSYKPNKDDPSGAAATNLPWMYPEVLPIIRKEIKWRYEFLPFFNSLMWESHNHAVPTNAWIGFGDFSTDPELYTEKVLKGFDAWLGYGQLLSAPALFEGMLTREVYFPKSSPSDDSLYFDLNAPNATYKAGTWATVSTPLEHMGLFAREGAVIPIGKDYATVTQTSGPGRTTTDGVDVVLEEDGGVVGLDDFRGLLLFPGTNGKTYHGHWTEDDGISMKPETTVVDVKYSGDEKEVKVYLEFKEHGFKTLWGKTVKVMLPVTDKRTVQGAKQSEWRDRVVWEMEVA